jgi:hypothetical protein
MARAAARKTVEPAAPVDLQPPAGSGSGRGREFAFHLLEDGAISNARVERFALFVVDGVPPTKAWELAGYADPSTSGGSRDWMSRARRHPAFLERMAVLEAERKSLEASPSPFAAARWSAQQLWRDARAAGDVKESGRAAELLFKIGEREANLMAAAGNALPLPGPLPSGSEAGHGPGAPSTGSTASRAKGVAELAAGLVALDIPQPVPPAVAEDQAA